MKSICALHTFSNEPIETQFTAKMKPHVRCCCCFLAQQTRIVVEVCRVSCINAEFFRLICSSIVSFGKSLSRIFIANWYFFDTNVIKRILTREKMKTYKKMYWILKMVYWVLKMVHWVVKNPFALRTIPKNEEKWIFEFIVQNHSKQTLSMLYISIDLITFHRNILPRNSYKNY